MKEFLHLYGTQSEWSSDYNGAAYYQPWVSYEKENRTVAYNKRKRLVVLTSASDSKTYDGTVLANDEVTVSGEGFKAGEGAVYDFGGEQVLVGASDNTFVYALNPGTSASDYNIRVEFGTLEVTDGTGAGEDPVDPELVVTMLVDETSSGEGPYKLGDTVYYEVTATNIYEEQMDISLSSIEGVTLDQVYFSGVEGGQTVTTQARYGITEADILAGEFTASVTASVGNLSKRADCAIATESPNPVMTIGIETLTTPPAGTEYFPLDETIQYEVTVTNDGNMSLSEIRVSSTDGTIRLNGLPPGESETRQFSHVVTEEDIAAEEINVAWTGTATNPSLEPTFVNGNQLVEAPEEPNPVLTIIPQTVSVPFNGEYYTLGEWIQYQITVENAGNLTLTNIEISSSDDSDTFDSLSPGSSQIRQFSHVVTEEDVLAAGVNVEWTGTADNPSTYPTSVENVYIQEQIEGPNPHATISFNVTSEPENGEYYTLGETVEYDVTVTNDGNLTMSNFELESSDGDTFSPNNPLGPLESVKDQFYHDVTQTDVANEAVEITWTGTANNPSSVPTVLPSNVLSEHAG